MRYADLPRGAKFVFTGYNDGFICRKNAHGNAEVQAGDRWVKLSFVPQSDLTRVHVKFGQVYVHLDCEALSPKD